MNYLITGGAGFIGTNIAKLLLKEGHTVRSIDNYSGGKMESRVIEGVEYVNGDIRNMDDLMSAMKGIDGVFHTAAIPRMPYSVEHPQETNDNNVTGTLNVLVAARDSGVKRLVYSASSSAYGNQDIMPLVETMKPRPESPYGLQKYIGEEYCRLFSSLYNFETVALRYFNVYGPYMDPNGGYALVIGKFLRQKKDGEPMTICGDGEYYRDYTHVEDIARANYAAMTSQKEVSGEVINIGNHSPYSVNQLVEIIGGESTNVAERAGDPRRTDANISKAKELLDWTPQINLVDGVNELKKEYNVE